MSLDHDSMVDRLSSSAKQKKTQMEEELEKWQQKKQELMVSQNRDYMESLFKENAHKPVKVGSVQVTNSQNFRSSFVLKQLEPLLKSNLITLENFFEGLNDVSSNFKNSGSVENMFIQLQEGYDSAYSSNRSVFGGLLFSNGGNSSSRGGPSSAYKSSDSLSITPVIHLVPVKRFYAKTGTNVGNGEGDGYIQFQLKNLFGGAENLTFDATTGTKTQSSYLLNYNQPLLNNSKYMWENSFYMNTKNLDWLKCDSKVKGWTMKVFTQNNRAKGQYTNHDLSIENCWRTVSNTQSKAIDVLSQSGNDFKSALLYNWKYDTRDNVHLPSKGGMLRFGFEYSGLFPHLNNSRFTKSVVEGQYVQSCGASNSLIFTSKAGLLVPIGKGKSSSHVLDRFYIGGPNDVRSFLLNGLGPKSYNTSIGGDLFLNGGVSLVSRIPRLDPASNFRFHNFINFGKLIPFDSHDQGTSLSSTFKSLSQMSTSYGFGILYNHPMARFELNFVLPLVSHERDYLRKGIQYGIGVSFL